MGSNLFGTVCPLMVVDVDECLDQQGKSKIIYTITRRLSLFGDPTVMGSLRLVYRVSFHRLFDGSPLIDRRLSRAWRMCDMAHSPGGPGYRTQPTEKSNGPMATPLRARHRPIWG